MKNNINYVDLTYPKLKYTEEKRNVKGLLLATAILSGGYLMFIAIIGLKLGFL